MLIFIVNLLHRAHIILFNIKLIEYSKIFALK